MLPSVMLSQYSVNINASTVTLVQLPYYILMDLSSVYGSLLPTAKQNVQSYVDTFTPSQQAAFEWLTGKLQCGDKLSAAIIGPAGTGKS